MAAGATVLKSPPVFHLPPLLKAPLQTHQWCSTPGPDALASPLLRSGMFMFAAALLLARLFSPSSQTNIIIPLSSVILTLSLELLLNTQNTRQSTIGEHPVTLELFLIALPSWLGLLCTSPLRVLSQVTEFSPGTAIFSFLIQTVAVCILAFTQIFISIRSNRFLGMDMRKYEITRNLDPDMKRVYDGSATEYTYQGENLCGRRAVLVSQTLYLDSPKWANCMIAWAVFAVLVWIILTALWVRKIKGYFFLGNGEGHNDCDIEIKDGFPALSGLHRLFRDGEVPCRTPFIKEKHAGLGMSHKETGWGGYLRNKLNFQLVILDMPRRHFEIFYGFGNPVNISYCVMLLRLVGFILVSLSVERTITEWNILFGRGTSAVGKDGNFWRNEGSWNRIREANGILIMVLGTGMIVTVVCGWIGEWLYWRAVKCMGQKVRSNRGLGKRV